ncbi:thiol:disulfide interchange protein DsbD [Povalibacter uvarum]|uniref:Thiol:disulfide interchange protein DsbD n=1 Tax=Povalibacter uvarum TaxID=732238 RepID=A0A841HQZ6_9GAMM|nr:protein-disulfide reductase DsbD [Povalibacter uvarum]MBB6094650.1 thiol:disulfide interchange protein DsbD [Povalibacter uvarum]
MSLRRAMSFELVARMLAVLLTLGIGASAWAKDEFLPPTQAYKYSTRVENDQLIVTWNIEKGYYLYKKKMGVASTMGTVQLGEPLWPKGESHSDEYFGEQEIYRGKVDIPVPVTFHGGRPPKLAFELKLQGCADAGLCYPPQKWAAEAIVPAAAAVAATSNDLRSFLKPKGNTQDDFLPPDEAFKFGAGMERPDSVALTWIIAEGYYLYKHRISVTTDSTQVQLGQPVLPKGKPKHDEFFGDTEVYYEVLEASLPVARAAGSTGTLTLNVTYQGCAEDGLCYNPITKTVSLELPPTDVATELPEAAAPSASAGSGAPVAEQDRLAAALAGGNLAYALLTFFGAGLLLSLTPCVLPMIPILSGIIVGQGENVTRRRSFALAFTYVQGMALTYAAAGAIFVLAFKQAPQAFFQQPWIITLMVLLFTALALAMFGAYTLQLPASMQTRLTDVSNRQKSGTYIGTFIMGALSALVVTACVAPAIIAALSVISQSREIMRGALALYATGLGMGVPLLIVGASAGTLLPKAGPWMDTVKQLFGVLFLGVAIYLAQPLLPDTLTMLLWSALAAISGFWIFSLKGRSGAPIAAPVRAVGLMSLVYGILLLIGAASGSHDPLQPLSHLRGVSGATAAEQHGIAFQRIKTVADLDRQVAAAQAAGKPVMLDFYADWCVSCKEMEKYTFTNTGVQAALANAVLLQADVTANDDADKALLARFEIFGPPTIAFFDHAGVELKNFRLVGFVPAERFRDHVAAAFGAT